MGSDWTWFADAIENLGGEPAKHFCIPSGTSVYVHDLVKAAQHNGKLGAIKHCDRRTKRHIVDFPDGVQLSLRTDNLTQRLQVQLVLNSEVADAGDSPTSLDATICGSTEGATGITVYKLEGIDEELEVPPEQVRLPEGSMLCVVGLTSERGRQLNG